jgi:ABC-2 type transport system ATP-binding protein
VECGRRSPNPRATRTQGSVATPFAPRPLGAALRFLASLVASLFVCVLFAGCSQAPPPTPFERVEYVQVESFDGHLVPVTMYRPEGEGPFPVVLHFHGWGGSRETRLAAFRNFTDAGLGVASVDLRGHGEARATSQARVARPDYEIRDVSAVLDHLATMQWIRLDAVGDPRVGVMGESYGGATSLLASALDARVDAVAAKDTWNDLAQAMAPGGVPKTAWFAGLWLSASIQGRIHPEARQGFESAVQLGRIPGPGDEVDLQSLFRQSSPAEYRDRMRAPTLIVQGANDTLFDLAEGLRNFAAAQSSGASVSFVAHPNGHRLAPGGRAPSACGAFDALALDWMRDHLLERPRQAGVCLAFGASASRMDAMPMTRQLAFDVGSVSVHPGVLDSRALAGVDAPAGTYFGVPRLSGTAEGNGTVYWSLEEGGLRVNEQVRGHRVVEGPFEIDLAPIAWDVQGPLSLVVAGQDPMFAAVPPGEEVLLESLRITLPRCDRCDAR